MSEVRVRIAPSPTGFPHIGTIYQAMFDFVFAKANGGKFIVRIEDTDRARFVGGAEEVIYESLNWFELEADESPLKGGPFAPYKSSERLEIYQKYADQLIENGNAYYCFCTKGRLDKVREELQKNKQVVKYDRFCLNLSKEEIDKNLAEKISHVIRLKIPDDQIIRVHDEIAGEIEFDSNIIDDQVLIKSDGFPTYHLAAVVDDYLMKISHIFRGTEWLPSTPKHILLYRFLGWEKEIPKFVHLPLILNTDGKGKLSKRDAAASVDFYKDEGYLPEVILNYLSNIVWNHPEGKEIYSLDEFIKLFKINDLEPKGARFDLAKLSWMNGEYIRKMSDEEFSEKLGEFYKGLTLDKEKIKKLTPLVKERMKTLRDFETLTDFIFEKPEYDLEPFKKLKIGDDKEKVKKVLEEILKVLESLEKPWRAEGFEKAFKKYAVESELTNFDVFQLIRIAVSGQLVTPPLFESIQILGEEETLKRVKKVLENYPNFTDLEKDLDITTD